MVTKLIAYKFPKAIGACADKFYKLRQNRRELQNSVKTMKEEESAIMQYIIDNLPKSEASGVQGKIARATVIVKEKPIVKDQSSFRKYLNRSKRFDLACALQPSAPAIREMWEDGKDIPGIEKFNVVTVSLNKV